MDDEYKTFELEDVTDEQRLQTFVCSRCGWEGKVDDMVLEGDCGDEWDAVYSPFCCPECLNFYLYLENWKTK